MSGKGGTGCPREKGGEIHLYGLDGEEGEGGGGGGKREKGTPRVHLCGKKEPIVTSNTPRKNRGEEKKEVTLQIPRKERALLGS